MSEFKVGSVVQLKSGGPYMTISSIGDYSESGGPVDGTYCIWFEKEKKMGAVFDARVLNDTGD